MKSFRTAGFGQLRNLGQSLYHGEEKMRRHSMDGPSGDAQFLVYPFVAVLVALCMATAAFWGSHAKMPLNAVMQDISREGPAFAAGRVVSVGSALKDAKPAEITPPEQSRRKPVRYVF